MKLTVNTDIDEIVVCGEYCNWNLEKATVIKRKPNYKSIIVSNMPKGEYKLLSGRDWANEELDTIGKPNRYFDNSKNESVVAKF